MSDAFDARLVNGPFDDPALYVSLRYQRRALLFDLGTINTLSTREVLKISHLFVSHTHMDHFIGFDHWLRCSLNKEEEVHLFGPREIIANVRGKLASYSWNLIHSYPLKFTVHEFDGGRRVSACFSAANAFRPEPVDNAPSEGVLVDEPSFTVRAAILDHRIPCLAFSLEEKSRLNIRRDVLHAMGLRGGPWLDELKRMLREKLPESTSMEIPEKNGGRNRLTLKEWRAALVLETKGQKIVYVVDNLFNSENVEKVISLAQQADLFYCESTFAKTDEDRAKETYHLTAPQAGNLARMAQVRHLIPFHFSPRYQAEPNRLLEEALQAFAKG